MKVDQALVRHIAKLARIKVNDEEADHLKGELSAILNWVEQLNEVETDGVEPMTRVVDMTIKKREDRVNDGHYPDDIVVNAPQKQEHFFVVPKVVE